MSPGLASHIGVGRDPMDQSRDGGYEGWTQAPLPIGADVICQWLPLSRLGPAEQRVPRDELATLTVDLGAGGAVEPFRVGWTTGRAAAVAGLVVESSRRTRLLEVQAGRRVIHNGIPSCSGLPTQWAPSHSNTAGNEVQARKAGRSMLRVHRRRTAHRSGDVRPVRRSRALAC